MNPWDIVVGACVALVIGLAVFYMIRNKRKGSSCCGGGCDGACGGVCGGGCGGCTACNRGCDKPKE